MVMNYCDNQLCGTVKDVTMIGGRGKMKRRCSVRGVGVRIGIGSEKMLVEFTNREGMSGMLLMPETATESAYLQSLDTDNMTVELIMKEPGLNQMRFECAAHVKVRSSK